MFERLADAGVRSACTPVPDLPGPDPPRARPRGTAAAGGRGRELPPRDLGAGRALLRRAVREPRRSPCTPTLARPGTRDEYSACVGRRAGRARTSTTSCSSRSPTTTTTPTGTGLDAQVDSIAHADAAFAELVDAAGGIDAFCDAQRGDPARRPRADRGRAARCRWPRRWASDGRCSSRTPTPGRAELAVSPTARAGAVYVLAEGRRGTRSARRRARAGSRELDGVDLVAWLARDGAPTAATPPERRGGRRARRRRASLPARLGGRRSPRRAAGTSTATSAALDARARRRTLRVGALSRRADAAVVGAARPERG